MTVNKFSRLEPPGQLQEWATMVLQTSDQAGGKKNLQDVLINLNLVILGLERQGDNLLGMFRDKCKPMKGLSRCQATLEFRDYLIALQVQGYALLLTALNCSGDRRGAIMAQMMARQRLFQQEATLGSRFNDW